MWNFINSVDYFSSFWRYQRDLVCELYHLFSGQSPPFFYKGCDFQSVLSTLLTGKFTALNSNNRICLNYWAIISATINFSYFGASLKIFSNAFIGFTKPFHKWQCILSTSPFLIEGGALRFFNPYSSECINLGYLSAFQKAINYHFWLTLKHCIPFLNRKISFMLFSQILSVLFQKMFSIFWMYGFLFERGSIL